MAKALITNPLVTEALDDGLGTPSLTSDNAHQTADGQADHMVDVWFLTIGAYGHARNGLGQSVWYHFTSSGEAEEWFNEITATHDGKELAEEKPSEE
jgi:hypothetical protein